MACAPHGGRDELLVILQALVQQQEKTDGKQPKPRVAVDGAGDGDLHHGSPPPRSVATDRRNGQSRSYRAKLAQRRQVLAAKTALQERIESAPPTDFVSSDWDFIESCEYWNTVILANHNTEQMALNYYNPRVYRPSPSLRCNVIITALSYRISSISRARGLPVLPSEPSDIMNLWTNYYQYMGESIRVVNNAIAQASDGPTKGLFALIVCILSAEVYLSPTSWRAHIEGFLALLQLRGGTQKIVSSRECSEDSIHRIALYANMANTTSPSDNQIIRTSNISTADIQHLFSTRLNPNFACPTSLFLEIVTITDLRVQLAAGASVNTIRPAASMSLARINAFAISKWSEKFELPEDVEPLHLAVLIFKSAVALYAMLSLPILGSASVPSEHQEMSTRLAYRDQLLQLTRTAWETLTYKASLAWPLVVAGVALAGGPESEQTYVVERLIELGNDPDKDPSPLLAAEKLKTFWASGKTKWDDCFDEPMTVLA